MCSKRRSEEWAAMAQTLANEVGMSVGKRLISSKPVHAPAKSMRPIIDSTSYIE